MIWGLGQVWALAHWWGLALSVVDGVEAVVQCSVLVGFVHWGWLSRSVVVVFVRALLFCVFGACGIGLDL